MICYLIHFERKVGHACHYLGTTKNYDERMRRHRAGTGGRLLQVANERGIPWAVVRTWQGGRQKEIALKRYHSNTRLCPVCNPDGWRKWAQEDCNGAF